jgi:hypothetical protein
VLYCPSTSPPSLHFSSSLPPDLLLFFTPPPLPPHPHFLLLTPPPCPPCCAQVGFSIQNLTGQPLRYLQQWEGSVRTIQVNKPLNDENLIYRTRRYYSGLSLFVLFPIVFLTASSVITFVFLSPLSYPLSLLFFSLSSYSPLSLFLLSTLLTFLSPPHKSLPPISLPLSPSSSLHLPQYLEDGQRGLLNFVASTTSVRNNQVSLSLSLPLSLPHY